MSQLSLATARLTLVPLADHHVELEVALDSDLEVMRYLAARPSDRADVERAHAERMELAREAPGMGLWVGSSAGECVGWWLLRPRVPVPVEGEAELGYRLAPPFWRRGLASEGSRELLRHAFDDLGVARVFAETMVANRASRATMVRIGLSYVRTFPLDGREHRPGLEQGGVEYAMTRDEWLADPGRARRPQR